MNIFKSALFKGRIIQIKYMVAEITWQRHGQLTETV